MSFSKLVKMLVSPFSFWREVSSETNEESKSRIVKTGIILGTIFVLLFIVSTILLKPNTSFNFSKITMGFVAYLICFILFEITTIYSIDYFSGLFGGEQNSNLVVSNTSYISLLISLPMTFDAVLFPERFDYPYANLTLILLTYLIGIRTIGVKAQNNLKSGKAIFSVLFGHLPSFILTTLAFVVVGVLVMLTFEHPP